MKLNFLNVLSKKSTPEEIAEQIVALEAKKAQCEKSRDEAKNVCKEFRGKTMCGEKVNSEDIKAADKAYNEAVLDLEVVTESLEELNKNLYVAIEARRNGESSKIIDERHKWQVEREKLMLEADKVKGQLIGLLIGIYGHDYEAKDHLESSAGFLFTNSHPHFMEFTKEKEKTVAELRRPRPIDLENAIQKKQHWLDTFDVDEEYSHILKQYRNKVA